MAALDDCIGRLAAASPADLRAAWQDSFGEAAPAVSPSLLRRALAHHVQEQVHGGLSAATLRLLGVAGGSRDEIKLKPGTRLLREWNGVTHTVLVTADGLRFGERSYASLSQIAREITGAHWSGPRFFGRRPAPPSRGGSAHD